MIKKRPPTFDLKDVQARLEAAPVVLGKRAICIGPISDWYPIDDLEDPYAIGPDDWPLPLLKKLTGLEGTFAGWLRRVNVELREIGATIQVGPEIEGHSDLHLYIIQRID